MRTQSVPGMVRSRAMSAPSLDPTTKRKRSATKTTGIHGSPRQRLSVRDGISGSWARGGPVRARYHTRLAT
jgi:hypothetical protein